MFLSLCTGWGGFCCGDKANSRGFKSITNPEDKNFNYIAESDDDIYDPLAVTKYLLKYNLMNFDKNLKQDEFFLSNVETQRNENIHKTNLPKKVKTYLMSLNHRISVLYKHHIPCESNDDVNLIYIGRFLEEIPERVESFLIEKITEFNEERITQHSKNEKEYKEIAGGDATGGDNWF